MTLGQLQNVAVNALLETAGLARPPTRPDSRASAAARSPSPFWLVPRPQDGSRFATRANAVGDAWDPYGPPVRAPRWPPAISSDSSATWTTSPWRAHNPCDSEWLFANRESLLHFRHAAPAGRRKRKKALRIWDRRP